MFVTKGPRLRHQYTSEIVLTALAKKSSGFWGVLEWHAVPKARTDTWQHLLIAHLLELILLSGPRGQAEMSVLPQAFRAH